MFGIKNDSKIIRLKRPETKIGRNRKNHVVLAKSLKISRFHARIKFFESIPFIIDVSINEESEWGVFLNRLPLPKKRWVEIGIGDTIVLGAPSVEEEGCAIEIVDLEPEDGEVFPTNDVPNEPSGPVSSSVQTIDITSDDDMKIENHPPPEPSSPRNLENESSDVNILDEVDDDDNDIIFYPAEFIDAKPVPKDVTATVNGLLKEPPVESPPPEIPSTDEIEKQLAEVVGEDMLASLSPIQNEIDMKPNLKQEYHFENTQDLCNVLNYSNCEEIITLDSDEEDFPSSQMDTSRINDVPNLSPAFNLMYELKSEDSSDDEDVKFISQEAWFGPLSQTIDDVKKESKERRLDIDEPSFDEIDNTETSSVSSPISSPSPSIESRKIEFGVPPKRQNKTAVVIPIQALPLKTSRKRSFNDTDDRDKKNRDHEKRKRKSEKEKSHKTTKSPSTTSKSRSHSKETRKKVQALYPKQAAEETIQPKERKSQPKVKVTSANRGHFLLDSAPSTSTTSPTLPKSTPATKAKTEPDDFPTKIPKKTSTRPFVIGKSILKVKRDEVKFTNESASRPDRKKVTFHDRIISKCKDIEVEYETIEISSYKKYEQVIRQCLAEFERALAVILGWNVKWLQEQQKTIAPPPIYSMNVAVNLDPEKTYIARFKEEVKESLFRGAWRNIFKAWNIPNNDDFPLTQVPGLAQASNYYTIDVEKVDGHASRHSNSLMTIHAKKEVLFFDTEDKTITSGKLTILNFYVIKPGHGEKTKTMAFAYISSYSRCSEGGRIFDRIILKISAKPFQVVCTEAKMKVLNYAKTFLKLFQTLGMTETCPIIKQLCDNKFHEELSLTSHDMKSKSSRILNEDQRKAVSTSLNCLAKKSSLSFVDGPFGTGKTMVIVSLLQELSNRNESGKILVVTINDKLADDLVYRIGRDDSVRKVLRFGNCSGINHNVKHCSFDNKVQTLMNTEGQNLVDIEDEIKILNGQLMKIANEKQTTRSSNHSKSEAFFESKRQQFDRELQELRQENSKTIIQLRTQIARSKVVETADIVVVPYYICWSSNFENYFVPNNVNKADFSPIKIVIFDDANFLDENAMLIPQMLQVQHMILVGDKTVIAYQNSPYHKMLLSYTNSKKNFVTSLSLVHRSHPEVIEWVRDEFKLKDRIKAIGRKKIYNLKCFSVIDHVSSDLFNHQGILCEKMAKCIFEMGIDRPNAIGILVTRTSDKDNLRAMFTASNLQNKVMVDLFDGNSTREMEIVIVCLPNSSIAEQWLYIALTRAKSAVIIIGDFNAIAPVPAIITRMLEYAKNKQVYFSLRNNTDVGLDKLKSILTC